MRKRLTAGVLAAIAALLAISAGAYWFATGGVPDREPASWLTTQPIAHRGLWTDSPARPENSLAAFDAAAREGYAIELDVQLSSDGKAIVFHDENLLRMTGTQGIVADTPLAELQSLRLLGGAETIPTLEETLRLVDGRVPVFVEIKNPGEVGVLEDEVARILAAYGGNVAVQSFNPFSVARVAAAAPDLPRGQLSSALREEDLAFYEVFLLSNLLMNWKSRPDFIAYDLQELPSLGTTIQRWRGRPLIGWTAETAEQRTASQGVCDAVMCNPAALGLTE